MERIDCKATGICSGRYQARSEKVLQRRELQHFKTVVTDLDRVRDST